MSTFSKQLVHCNTCAAEFSTTFFVDEFGGRFCSDECHTEFHWRKALSVLGEPYRKNPVISVIHTGDFHKIEEYLT